MRYGFSRLRIDSPFISIRCALVELHQQFANGLIEVFDREEPAVSQRRHDPALNHQSAAFYLGLGEKRALHAVAMMAHKSLPSRTLSIR